MKFITINRADAQLRSYLDGTFSSTLRALPLEFYSLNSHRPTVTLRLEPAADCRKGVSTWKILGDLSRWHQLAFTTGALMMFSLLNNSVAEFYQNNGPLVLLVWLSVSLLHVGANLLNDYFDHLAGADLLQHRGGSRVIQRGWLAAWQVYRYALITLGSGVVLGLTCLYLAGWRSVEFAIVAASGIFVYSQIRRSLKKIGLAEISLFALCGPALLFGYQYLLDHSLSINLILFSCWNGLAAAQFVFLRNWQSLQSDGTLGIQTLALRMGFDNCRACLLTLSGFRWLIWAFYVLQQTNVGTLAILLGETLLFFNLYIGSSRVCSVFSSDLLTMRRLVLKHNLRMLLVALIASSMSYGKLLF